MALHHYLPQDRLRALAEGRGLPAHARGSALFADISGFTALTEALTRAHGEQRGVELLSRAVSEVYDALIAEVERFGGTTLSFAGDATLCWFDAADGAGADAPALQAGPGAGPAAGADVAAASRAVRAALALQAAMQSVARSVADLLGQSAAQAALRSAPRRPASVAEEAGPALALKVSVASGTTRRFTVGDAAIQTLDVLAGPAVSRVALADTLAEPGDVLLDEATAHAVKAPVMAWRTDPGAPRFAVLAPGWPGPAPHRASERVLADAANDTPGEARWPDADQLRPWVLPFVYERERAGAGLFVTDLRPVVALFLRFGGLEDAHGALDDSAVQRLDGWIRATQRVLQQHGGVLLELIVGDKGSYLYAAFGAAQAHEDDAHRALHAALALRALFGAEAGSAAGSAAGACIGVASGTLRVGGYGSRTRQSFGAQGDAVNAAARLMLLASPGEILASGRVRAAVAPAFALQPRAPIALRGQAEPMPVFAVLAAQRPRARRLQALDFVLPMIGRDGALQQLQQRLHEACQGQGAAVFVQAEAGMGKSRLLAEAARLALGQGFVGYGGAAGGEGLQSPYRLWHGVWMALLELDPARSPRLLARAVEDAVARCAHGRAEAWPLLGPVLGLELPHNAFTEALAPPDRKRLLETLLIEALRQAAADAAQDGAGVLLVLDDVHDADPLSLELLAAVVRNVAALPVLVLASQRPSGRRVADEVAAMAAPAQAVPGQAVPGGESATRVERIVLRELDAAQSEQLVRAQLAALFPERAGLVPPALIEQVIERAQGNPFTIEELLRHLRDRGLDPHRPDSLQRLDWPRSLRSLVLSRIDRLGMPAQLALKLASVIGSPFGLAELQACHPAPGSAEALRAELGRLVELGLLQSADSTDPGQAVGAEPGAAADGDGDGDPHFAFCQRLTQAVAYESLGQASLVRLHAKVAERLEARRAAAVAGGGVAPAALSAQLAHHWARAERTDRAWPHRLHAAGQAAASHANDEALAGFTQVLGWLPEHEHAVRAEVLLRREALLQLMGRHAERRQDLEALEAMAAEPAQASQQERHEQGLGREHAALSRRRLLLRRAALELDVGEFAAAAVLARQALVAADAPAAAGAAETPAASTADDIEAHLLLGQVLFAGGQAAQARAPLEQALAMAGQQGQDALAAKARLQLGMLAWQLGHYEDAEALMRGALPAIQHRGALRDELTLRNNLGVLAKSRARFAEALAHYEAARVIARRIGDRSGEAMLLNNMGTASLAAGDFYRAAQDAEAAGRIWAGLNEPAQLAAAWVNRAEAHRELGQLALAQSLGEQALALLQASGQRRVEAIVLENLGRVALARGEHAQAAARLQAALALAREIGLRAIEASTLFDLGRLHTAQGLFAEAQAALAEAGRLMQALGDPLGQLDVQTARAELCLLDPGRSPGERAQAARAELAEWLPRLMPPAPAGTAPAAELAPGVLLPMAAYCVAWRVLAALGDRAAATVHAHSLATLRDRAARIPDPHIRRDYLQLPEHLALLGDAAATG